MVHGVGWLLLALLFTAIALALPITRGSSGRAIKGKAGKADLPSWLHYAIMSYHAMSPPYL
jgi:hypothetical protein